MFDFNQFKIYRGKWGKVSHLFSWLRGGEIMKIELFFHIDCESLIFCEQPTDRFRSYRLSPRSPNVLCMSSFFTTSHHITCSLLVSMVLGRTIVQIPLFLLSPTQFLPRWIMARLFLSRYSTCQSVSMLFRMTVCSTSYVYTAWTHGGLRAI